MQQVTSTAVILNHMPQQKLQDGKHSVYTSSDTVAALNSGTNKTHSAYSGPPKTTSTGSDTVHCTVITPAFDLSATVNQGKNRKQNQGLMSLMRAVRLYHSANMPAMKLPSSWSTSPPLSSSPSSLTSLAPITCILTCNATPNRVTTDCSIQ